MDRKRETRRDETRRDERRSILSLSLRNSFLSRASRCLEQRPFPTVSLVRKTSLDGKVNARVSLPRDLPDRWIREESSFSGAREERFYRRRKLRLTWDAWSAIIRVNPLRDNRAIHNSKVGKGGRRRRRKKIFKFSGSKLRTSGNIVSRYAITVFRWKLSSDIYII